MWPCCRPARVVLPTWQARLPQLPGPSSAFSNFTTSRTTFRIQPITLKRSKRLKVYSFKGNSETDEGPRDGHRSFRKTASLSCSQQESGDIIDSATSLRNQVSVSPEREEETVIGSQAVENIFKRWLILLRSQKPSSVDEQIHKEESGRHLSSETNYERQKQLVGNLLKAVFLRFWAWESTLKFPLLMVPPAYLAVRLVYGVEIARELTPMWILGPIVVAQYIKLIRWVCSLYVLFFRLVFIMPISCVRFIIEGKLNAYIHQKFWLPIVAIRNMDFKEFYLQEYKKFRERAHQRWEDYKETVWPYYCRTIRFLKQTNLI